MFEQDDILEIIGSDTVLPTHTIVYFSDGTVCCSCGRSK